MRNKQEIEKLLKYTKNELKQEQEKYKDIYTPLELTIQRVKYLKGMIEALKWILKE